MEKSQIIATEPDANVEGLPLTPNGDSARPIADRDTARPLADRDTARPMADRDRARLIADRDSPSLIADSDDVPLIADSDSPPSPAVATDPESEEIATGTVVAGKYRLDRLLGSGAMGTVWAGTHLALDERVALKFVSSTVALSEEVRARFVREARAAARLNSRFTVRVFDTGDFANGIPYIVMEYLEGETLNQFLQREGRMTLPDTVRILVQVARGLTRAHTAGIVHRDIKPENIFLAHTADDGVIAKVFDFGVAKLAESAASALHDATQTGVFVGTPQFMSPEQALGERDVDHRADIYSLGVLAHRMLTGQRLFAAESFAALLIQICGDTPLPKLRDAWPEAPPAVDEWFQRTCARNRSKRYPSAMECVEALVVAAGLNSALLTDASVALPSSYKLAKGVGAYGASSPRLPFDDSVFSRLEPDVVVDAAELEAPSRHALGGRRRTAALAALVAVIAAIGVAAAMGSAAHGRKGSPVGTPADTANGGPSGPIPAIAPATETAAGTTGGSPASRDETAPNPTNVRLPLTESDGKSVADDPARGTHKRVGAGSSPTKHKAPAPTSSGAPTITDVGY